MSSIREKVERSSFGTSAARAARRSVSEVTAAKILARAATIPAPVRDARSKKPGG
ncbi:MAG: hypothetical protein ACRDRI_11275 [Pseudonocardiaceae bacterium]